MEVSIDVEVCTGHGRCYALAPELFAPDDDGFNAAVGTTVHVAPEHKEAARRAATSCPERAIKVLS
jgi:ferredoxin